MEKEQIKYVAVNHQGKICGPIGDTSADVALALKIEHKRAGFSGRLEDITQAGYQLWKAKVTLIKRV